MASTVFAKSPQINLHKVDITVVNTPLEIDSLNTTGIPGKHCILVSLVYYENAAHNLTFYNDTTGIVLPFDTSAGIQSSIGFIVFSDLGKPLKVESSVATTLLCGISYNAKFIGQ